MKKLICCDIDGTLLNSDLVLTDKTKECIRKTAKENIFAIVTGRFRAGIKEVLEQVPVAIPYVCFNGAHVEYNNEIIFTNPIDKNLLSLVIDEIKPYNASPIISTLDDWFMEKRDYWFEYQIKMFGFEGNLVDFSKQLKTDFIPYKVLIKDLDTKKIDKLLPVLQEKFGDKLSIVKSAPVQIEVLPLNTSKAVGVEKLEQHFSIDHKFSYAIGDYDNDIEMLEYAHTSIAMANAPDYIKKITTHTTLSNNEDGVVYAIENYIL